MKFILDVQFEDNNYDAIIYLVTSLVANSEKEAQIFVDEIIEAFKRQNITVLRGRCTRIDHDPQLRKNKYEYYQFCKNRATATIDIEEFFLENPDQTKSLVDNLIDKFMNGENSTANIGNRYKIPVRVVDKETKNPINHEFYYMNIEHLIPQE